jgi:hypothetical protein
VSTLTTSRPGESNPETTPGEPASARRVRLELRRKLVVWSLPAVLVLLLVALKLLSMVAFGDRARSSYDAGEVTAVEQAAVRLGFLNVIERHKAPFAHGDARVLAGDFGGARGAFEEALDIAPRDAVEGCQIRVNLVLSLEKLGDAAKTASGLDGAKPYYDRMQVVVADAPQGCFQPPAGDAGQQLGDARGRAEEKSQPPEADSPDAQPPQPQPPQPGADKQKQLDDKTQDNQQQRSQGQGDQSRDGASRPQVDKPW